MILLELFDEQDSNVLDGLKTDIIDILLPLVANNVPFVTIEQVMTKLRDKHIGIIIDRAIVTELLDPSNVRIVSRIEGNKIYFDLPDDGEIHRTSPEEKEKDDKKVEKSAREQAKKEIKKR